MYTYTSMAKRVLLQKVLIESIKNEELLEKRASENNKPKDDNAFLNRDRIPL